MMRRRNVKRIEGKNLLTISNSYCVIEGSTIHYHDIIFY